MKYLYILGLTSAMALGPNSMAANGACQSIAQQAADAMAQLNRVPSPQLALSTSGQNETYSSTEDNGDGQHAYQIITTSVGEGCVVVGFNYNRNP